MVCGHWTGEGAGLELQRVGRPHQSRDETW